MSAPFRIRPPKPIPSAKGTGAFSTPRAAESGSDEGFRSYLDRLLKMIPVEVVSLYLVGSGLVPDTAPLALVAWTLICLISVVLIRAYGTADPQQKLPPDWTAVGISSGAYIIWVYSVGGPFKAYNLHIPYLGSLLVLAWTFFIPMVYKGPDEVPAPADAAV